ncbi:MAG: PLP-dependent aminotransferase family protein [Nitrospirae bacterium]|nr:PLP-dependent aminotransferase family protein [Nitrospirota bacterium]
MSRVSERTSRLSGSLIREILAVANRPGVISFAGGLSDPEAMPLLALAEAPGALGQYGTSEGEPELRALIAERVSGLGRVCSPEQVLITAGSQQGLDLVAKLFIDPGTPVVVEAPTYLAALQVFRLFGARVVPVPVQPTGVDLDALDRSLAQSPSFIYTIPTFQNPSGACYSVTARQEVAALIDRAGVPLVEDDPYRELAYEAVDRTPICVGLERAPWIYLGSFSKIGLPGLRIGYLAASADLYPTLVKLKQAADLHTNRVGQWWAVRLLTDPGYPAHLDRLRTLYRIKRDAMARALDHHFRALADWSLPAGGLFFWLRLQHRVDTRTLLAPALERGVAFMPGEPFFPQDDPPLGSLRLSFSGVAVADIEPGLVALAALIRERIA